MQKSTAPGQVRLLAQKIDYLKALITENNLDPKFTQHLTIVENGLQQICAEAASLDDFEDHILYSYLKSQNKFLTDYTRHLEAQAAYSKTTTEASLQKYRLKNKKLIDLVGLWKPPPRSLSSFKIEDIDYPLLNLTNRQLETLSKIHLKSLALPGSPLKKIDVFVDKVRKGYNPVFYHNFTHAFSVMQFFFYMWQKNTHLQTLLDINDVYFCSISAICHDLGHSKHKKSYNQWEKITDTKYQPKIVQPLEDMRTLCSSPCMLPI